MIAVWMKDIILESNILSRMRKNGTRDPYYFPDRVERGLLASRPKLLPKWG